MEIFKTAAAIQGFALEQKRSGKRIGLVPTMGYLHEGHLSLVRRARELADVVIVSIFVNPTQFGPTEDLAKYPRDFERDCRLCAEHGVTAVFAPTPEAMYYPDHSVWVVEEQLSQGLCGARRPGHFRGVATVVAKLFNLTQPDVAVFGQKDAQQALVIRRMVRDLNFPIRIEVAPLVRDGDGLALSSRNRYLSEEERKRALVLSRSLWAAQAALRERKLEALDGVLAAIRYEIEQAGGRVDYVEGLDSETLQPPTAGTRKLLLLLAAYFGNTRLIDNQVVEL